MKTSGHRMLPGLALVALLLAGCTESPQVLDRKAGDYQGKVDGRPWEGGRYQGDKAKWESDLRARVGTQNESRRLPD